MGQEVNINVRIAGSRKLPGILVSIVLLALGHLVTSIAPTPPAIRLEVQRATLTIGTEENR